MAKKALLGSGLANSLKPKSTKPKVPSAPPLGSYDPAYDAQIRASQRGLRQATEDAGTAGSRADEDLATALSRAGQGRDRAMEDLATRETRGNRDFDTQLQNVFRQFGILGRNQTQAASAAGVLQGGTQRAAAKAREANTALARAPIDTARSDLMSDLTRSRARVGEDYWNDVIGAQTAYGRGGSDRQTDLQRAISEQGFYESDINAEKTWAASQANPDLFSALAGSSKSKGSTSGKAKTPTKKKKGKK